LGNSKLFLGATETHPSLLSIEHDQYQAMVVAATASQSSGHPKQQVLHLQQPMHSHQEQCNFNPLLQQQIHQQSKVIHDQKRAALLKVMGLPGAAVFIRDLPPDSKNRQELKEAATSFLSAKLELTDCLILSSREDSIRRPVLSIRSTWLKHFTMIKYPILKGLMVYALKLSHFDGAELLDMFCGSRTWGHSTGYVPSML
jgi:hypothetical protein